MKVPSPMVLRQQTQPFDDPNWIYEIKHDGFRAFAVIEHGQCRFFSRKRHKLYGYCNLREALAKEINADTAILDGELVVTDHLGRSVFASLMKRSQQVRYFAFDLLWINGLDLTTDPLIARKKTLKQILSLPHVVYVDHVKGAGQRLYALACRLRRHCGQAG
jgi:bifunctional non-homologous end joining protein LigD